MPKREQNNTKARERADFEEKLLGISKQPISASDIQKAATLHYLTDVCQGFITTNDGETISTKAAVREAMEKSQSHQRTMETLYSEFDNRGQHRFTHYLKHDSGIVFRSFTIGKTQQNRPSLFSRVKRFFSGLLGKLTNLFKRDTHTTTSTFDVDTWNTTGFTAQAGPKTTETAFAQQAYDDPFKLTTAKSMRTVEKPTAIDEKHGKIAASQSLQQQPILPAKSPANAKTAASSYSNIIRTTAMAETNNTAKLEEQNRQARSPLSAVNNGANQIRETKKPMSTSWFSFTNRSKSTDAKTEKTSATVKEVKALQSKLNTLTYTDADLAEAKEKGYLKTALYGRTGKPIPGKAPACIEGLFKAATGGLSKKAAPSHYKDQYDALVKYAPELAKLELTENSSSKDRARIAVIQRISRINTSQNVQRRHTTAVKLGRGL